MEVRAGDDRRSEIEKRVNKVLSENGYGEFSRGRVDGFDSLDKIELVMDFGEEFNVNISDEDLEKIFGRNFLGDDYSVPMNRFVDYIIERQDVVVK